jgi:hypothetical protein
VPFKNGAGGLADLNQHAARRVDAPGQCATLKPNPDSSQANTNGAAPASAKPMSSTERSRLCRERARAVAAAAAAAAPADAAPVAASVASADAAAAPVARVAAVAPNLQRVAIGVVLIIAAMALAGVGMSMTVTYNATTATGADRYLMGALAIAADLLTLVLPSAATVVWNARRRGLALAAVLLWVAGAGVTSSNISGFIATNTDTFVSAREVKSAERGLVLQRLERLRGERSTIFEARSVGEIVVAIRNATKVKVDDERAALAIAHRRDEIDGQLMALEETVRALPSVTMADPAASTLAAMVHSVTGVAIDAATLQRARFALLLVLPLLGGLVLAIGTALIGERGRS